MPRPPVCRLIVAINKIDKPGANPDRVKNALSEHGSDSRSLGRRDHYGGSVGQTEDRAGQPARDDSLAGGSTGTQGRSPPVWPKASSLKPNWTAGGDRWRRCWCRAGRCSVGDAFVVGTFSGRVRALITRYGGENHARQVRPFRSKSSDCRAFPRAGDPFIVVTDERVAREIAEERAQKQRRRNWPGRPSHAWTISLPKSKKATSKSCPSSSRPMCRDLQKRLASAVEKLSDSRRQAPGDP